MKLISWTGWTKDDWKIFLEKTSDMVIWPFFVFFLIVLMAVG